jgi:hypothetical protein
MRTGKRLQPSVGTCPVTAQATTQLNILTCVADSNGHSADYPTLRDLAEMLRSDLPSDSTSKWPTREDDLRLGTPFLWVGCEGPMIRESEARWKHRISQLKDGRTSRRHWPSSSQI